ncbi:MAG TPA: LacI family DNA-binding transcriptional regulator, partial [Chitinophagaceae bacterium]
MGDAITIKDIAKALGMSYSTVSRALKGSYKISEATRLKVKEYADAHHYRPNLLAQSLKSKKSRSIGVLLCSIPNNFFAEVINGIDSIAYNKDYHVILTQSLESYEREIKNLEHLAGRLVDGLLVSLATETTDLSHFRQWHDSGVPIVFFDRVTDLINTHKVVVDNAGGAYKAIQHLLENGYRKIAHITSSPNLSITQERLEGYNKALLENGISPNPDYIRYCQHGGMLPEEVEQAIEQLLSLPHPPDAVFTASDRITISTLSILHKRGIRIPQQLAMAGFSNFSAPELFTPPLTTVRQPAFEMGRAATELLIQLIESKQPVTAFEKKVLPAELIIRASS